MVNGDPECNVIVGAPGLDAWEYQTCTELLMPIGNNGKQDIFYNAPWTAASWNLYCQQTYGT